MLATSVSTQPSCNRQGHRRIQWLAVKSWYLSGSIRRDQMHVCMAHNPTDDADANARAG